MITIENSSAQRSDELRPVAVSVGHVHLRVSCLECSTAFYRDVLGLTVTFDGRSIGMPAVFLAGGEYHHHIALNTWLSQDGSPPEPGRTGLHHVAFLYPGEDALGIALRRVRDHGWPIDSAEDHGATVSVYLRDPDDNGIELYYDRPRSNWFDQNGLPVIKADHIDPDSLLRDPADSR